MDDGARTRLLARLVGAGAVGCVAVTVAAAGLLTGLDGTGARPSYLLALLVLATVLGILHRLTAGTPTDLRSILLSGGWGVVVLACALVLIGVVASARNRSGEAASWPAPVWWLLGGAAFALAGAALTRRTAVPAGAGVVLVLVAVIAL